MLGIHRHASETPLMAFRWRADDGPLKVGLGSSLPLPPSTLKTNVVKVGSPLTKLSGSARIQNILSEGVVREDRNATKNGPPSAHQRNAIVDNGPPLNAGLVAL